MLVNKLERNVFKIIRKNKSPHCDFYDLIKKAGFKCGKENSVEEIQNAITGLEKRGLIELNGINDSSEEYSGRVNKYSPTKFWFLKSIHQIFFQSHYSFSNKSYE